MRGSHNVSPAPRNSQLHDLSETSQTATNRGQKLIHTVPGASRESKGTFVSFKHVMQFFAVSHIAFIKSDEFGNVSRPYFAQNKPNRFHLRFRVRTSAVYNVKK